MKTCKDCYFFECCSTLNPKFKKYPRDYIETDLCAKQCTKFKDKSLIIELPRNDRKFAYCDFDDCKYCIDHACYKTNIDMKKCSYHRKQNKLDELEFLLDDVDVNRLFQLLKPLLNQEKEVNSLNLTRSEGNEFYMNVQYLLSCAAVIKGLDI